MSLNAIKAAIYARISNGPQEAESINRQIVAAKQSLSAIGAGGRYEKADNEAENPRSDSDS